MATKFKSSVEIDGYLSLTSGNWVQVPDGTTAQRPGSPTVGMFRYNTSTNEFEGYFGSTPAWGAIGGGGGTVTEAFKTIAVSGQSDIVADGPTDTLTVAAGNNVTLTTDAATDTLTIGSTAGGGTVTVERNTYTADGATTAFGVSSTIDSENNIQLYLDGVYQDKDVFTISGTTVTLGTAPANGVEVEIIHITELSGIVALDRFTGNGSTVSYSTSLSITNENATQVYIDGVYQNKDTYATAGNVVTFTTAPPNATTVEIVHLKATSLSGLNKNNFTGDGSTTAFTLSSSVNEENLSFVFIQGVYQDKSTYGISGTTLTFVTAPQNGYTIEVMIVTDIALSTSHIYTDNFTGNGSTTAYTLGVTPNSLDSVDVYLNGLYQNSSTLSLANNTLTFSAAPPNGVAIEVKSIGNLNIGGTLAPASITGGAGITVTNPTSNTFTITNQYGVNVISGNTTASAGNLYVFTASLALTLPAGTVGDSIKISNRSGVATCTVVPNGTDKIMGSNTTLTLNTASASFELIFSGTAQGWVIIGQ